MPHLEPVPGIDAYVTVNGQSATEYINPDEETQPNQVIRYIEAVPGAEFAINCRFHRTFEHWQNDFAISYTVDGKHIRTQIHSRQRLTYPEYEMSCEGAECDTSSGWQLLKFQFASLLTTEEKGLDAELLKNASHIGMIKVSVYRGISKGPISRSSTTKAPKEEASIPEKALKGQSISARTSYAAPQAISARRYESFDYIDQKKSPLAQFIFKYRTLDDLKAEHIIPRSESPEILDETQNGITNSQLKELLRKEREIVEQLQRRLGSHSVKSEISKSQSRVKRERAVTITSDNDEYLSFVTARAVKRTKPEPGTDIIDLSED